MKTTVPISKSLATAILVLVALFGGGCASYRVRPSADSVTLPKRSAPIPVAVTLTQTEQKIEGPFPDLLTGFKRALDENGTFQTVYLPASTGVQVDGDLRLKINARMKMDPTLFPKAFFTGFFLFIPSPVVWYKHKFEAECAMDVMRGAQKVKAYKSKVTAIASHQMLGGTTQMETDGALAAARLLYSDLLQQLQRDEQFLATELKRPVASAQ